MKKLSLLALLFVCTLTLYAQVHVRGYTRSNGTYVQPHYRSSPDASPYNNYSYPGNTNPYTGKTATGNPDTYLRNYNNQPSGTAPVNYPTTNYNYSSGSSLGSGNSYYSTPTPAPAYELPTLNLNLSIGNDLKVEESSAVHMRPDLSSPTIAVTGDWVVYEGDADNGFIKVAIKSQHGYLYKRWVNVEATRGRRYAGLVGTKVNVFQYSPLYQYASVGAKIIANADDKQVLILEDTNEGYFLVKYHNVKGYMPKKYIDD